MNKFKFPNQIKSVAKKLKRPHKVKPIKKDTWRRNLRALDLKLDHRQRERDTLPVPDGTVRVCSNCAHEYTGRYCPQCGQAGTWSRFSWRQAFFNLLDIWGLGSRPIFRTVRDLFWRPGYMVRDYLNGHRQFYFPPFKLLAVTLVLLIFVSFTVKKVLWLIGGDAIDLSLLETDSIFSAFIPLLEKQPFIGQMAIFSDALLWVLKLLTKNLLYEWLFVAVFLVFCIWIVFRRIGRYNFVETYIFFVFVLCQQWILLMAKKLGIGLCRLVELPTLLSGSGQPSSFYAFVASIFFVIASLISTVFIIYRLYLFVLNFRQFYGMKWKSTIGHLLLAVFVASWLIMIVAMLVIVFSIDMSDDRASMIIAFINVALIPIAFAFASSYLKKNESQVNRTVTIICKGAMLSVFGGIIFGSMMLEDSYTFLSVIFMTLAYYVVAIVLSLLPVYIYKKSHRTWLAFAPLPLLIGMIVLLSSVL